MDKVNIIYVASMGRSGSTLLSMMLENQLGLFGVGELTSIWKDGFINNHICTCGQPFNECLVWRAIVKDAFGEFSQVNPEKIILLKQSLERLRWIPGMLSPSRFPSNTQLRFKEYTDIILRLYLAIHKVSSGSIIVDSSKIPTYGFMLNSIDKFNVHIVHLIRDSRAVAYSWQKKMLRPDAVEQTYMPTYRPSLKSVEWNIYNMLFEYLGTRATTYQLLHYEELVSNPEQSIATILKTISSNAPLPRNNSNNTPESESHMFGGNPMRFRSDPLKISIDNEWLTHLTTYKKAMVTTITLPFLYRYGYGKSLFQET